MPTTIHSIITKYGLIAVDDVQDERHLLVNERLQGKALLSEPCIPTSLYMVEIINKVKQLKEVTKALVFGGGAFLIPSQLNFSSIETDVVEHNPEMLKVAKEYFDYDSEGKVFIRSALEQIKVIKRDEYDLIIVDLFNGHESPSWLEPFVNKCCQLVKHVIVNRIVDGSNRLQYYYCTDEAVK